MGICSYFFWRSSSSISTRAEDIELAFQLWSAPVEEPDLFCHTRKIIRLFDHIGRDCFPVHKPCHNVIFRLNKKHNLRRNAQLPRRVIRRIFHITFNPQLVRAFSCKSDHIGLAVCVNFEIQICNPAAQRSLFYILRTQPETELFRWLYQLRVLP